MKKLKPKTKEHITSAIITFVTAFAVTIIPVIDTLSLSSFEDGALAAIAFTALRAGVKAVFLMLAK